MLRSECLAQNSHVSTERPTVSNLLHAAVVNEVALPSNQAATPMIRLNSNCLALTTYKSKQYR